MTYRLERVQIVPGDIPSVFEFFKNPHNLETLTPPWLHFRILEASDAEVREGTRLVYRLRWQVVPLRWESRITEYQENVGFADKMVRGPYRRWYHRHRFRAVPTGVEIRDDIDYALPFGPVGRLAHTLVVRRQLEQIFAFRRRKIADIFGASRSPGGTHLILFAHGSAEPAWRVPLDGLAGRLAGEVAVETVRLAFLERMEPSLPDAVTAAAADGAHRILVLPIFVAAGAHLRQDVPPLVHALREQHPALAITMLPPIGEDARFADAVAAIVAAAVGGA